MGVFYFGFITPLCKHYYFSDIVLRTVKSASQVKSKANAFGEIKSVPSPAEGGFHHESDFTHRRWIYPVEDGFS